MSGSIIKTGLKRSGKEQFYTKSTIAKKCIEVFIKNVKPHKTNDTIIEPSAGAGSFNILLEGSFKFEKVYAYDIDPQSVSVQKQDFLKLSFDHFSKDYPIHIIGNPPFGRQSKLARLFIKKSVELASTISFILPKSFKKPSYQKTFPRHYHLLYQMDIPSNSFTIKNEVVDVPCVFQIWIKKEYERSQTPKIPNPINYSFISKEDNPDFAIRRVGVYAGKVSTKTDDKSKQSHYFIKLKNDSHNEDFVNKIIHNYLSTASYDEDNTVGPRSISKGELILQLNKCF